MEPSAGQAGDTHRAGRGIEAGILRPNVIPPRRDKCQIKSK